MIDGINIIRIEVSELAIIQHKKITGINTAIRFADILQSVPSLFTIKLIDAPNIGSRIGIDDCKDVIFSPCPVQQFCRFHLRIESGVVIFPEMSVSVMRLPDSVNRETGQKALLRKKTAPFLIQ